MKVPRPITILVAERRPAVRAAIRLFLEKQPGLAVAGEAADPRELLDRAATAHPDIVLLDCDLGDGPPAELIRELHQLNHQPRVIVLDVRPETAQAALAAGADAFASKSGPPRELLRALEVALMGENANE